MRVLGVCTRHKLIDESGFTLIETIVTLAIMVMVLGIVLSAMRLGIRSWEKGESVIEGSALRRSVTSRLSAEIGSMYPYTERSDGKEAVLFIGGPNAIGFVTMAGLGAHGLPWGGARWEYYSVRDGRLTVREKTVPGVDVEADSGGRLTELDRGVAGVNFEYLGKDGWEGSWEDPDKNGLPEAVRVTVSFTDGRRVVTGTVQTGLTDEVRKLQGRQVPAA